MLNIDTQLLQELVPRITLPFFRISSFFMLTPIWGTQVVPRRVRAILALSLTWLILPFMPATHFGSGMSVPLFLHILNEMLIGVGLAFVMIILWQVFVIAGQAVAMQMGLGFASMVDPANGVSVPIFGQFYILLITLLFFSMDGHMAVIQILVDSSQTIPVASSILTSGDFRELVGIASWMFAAGLLLALPAVTALLMVNISFGIMTKAAPQLNIFSLGFPLALLFGLVVWWIALGSFLPQFDDLTAVALQYMRHFVHAN